MSSHAPQTPGATRARLRVDIVDAWCAGSGRGRGRHLDALVVRDGHRLPYLPGRHLRGLLRFAVGCLDAWGHVGQSAQQIFGGRTSVACQLGRDTCQPGRLALTDAEMPDNERQWLLANAARGAVDMLFLSSYHTAIDRDKGVARAGSLRGVELVVPMTLYAQLEVEGQHAAEALDRLRRAAPLIRSVGGWRSRGYGRARVTIEAAP